MPSGVGDISEATFDLNISEYTNFKRNGFWYCIYIKLKILVAHQAIFQGKNKLGPYLTVLVINTPSSKTILEMMKSDFSITVLDYQLESDLVSHFENSKKV